MKPFSRSPTLAAAQHSRSVSYTESQALQVIGIQRSRSHPMQALRWLLSETVTMNLNSDRSTSKQCALTATVQDTCSTLQLVVG